MIYSLSTRPNLRARFTSWSGPFLFSLTFASLVAHQVCLSGLAQRFDEQADSTHLQDLEDRVVALEQSLQHAPSRQSSVSYDDLNLINESFNERLTELANAIAGVASETSLKALMDRVQELESNRSTPLPPTAAAKPRQASRKSMKPVEPPLQILGLEIRGGNRFLSVGPQGAQSLEQCQLIRVGETYSGWKLVGFEDEIAVFVANGQTHRLKAR